MCAGAAEDRFGPKSSVPELLDKSMATLSAKVDRLEYLLKKALQKPKDA